MRRRRTRRLGYLGLSTDDAVVQSSLQSTGRMPVGRVGFSSSGIADGRAENRHCKPAWLF